MKNVPTMPVLVAVLFAAACGDDDGGPTTVGPMARVRCFGSAATPHLQAGTVNTVAIVPTASVGIQLVNLSRC
jgi:hypothetical protein